MNLKAHRASLHSATRKLRLVVSSQHFSSLMLRQCHNPSAILARFGCYPEVATPEDVNPCYSYIATMHVLHR